MTRDPHDVVRVYSGPSVLVETYRAALTEAGVACQVVGTELAGSFGSALPESIELWVHRIDLSRAEAVINGEARPVGEPLRDQPRQRFPHPTDDPKPRPAPHRKERYVNPEPGA